MKEGKKKELIDFIFWFHVKRLNASLRWRKKRVYYKLEMIPFIKL